jgi:uncharacterized membrane protein SirB2
MENKPVSKYTISFGFALAICCVVNALLVIAKEKSPALQAAMKKMTGHHWITHSAIILLLFISLGFLLAQLKGVRSDSASVNRLIQFITAGVFLASTLILGFYLLAD